MPETPDMDPQASIAHYRITAKLGQGGMGEVWRAKDTKLNREVAIKILPEAFSKDPDRTARFTREAQVLASLNHPNIAQIYAVEHGALVMELVEGPTLAERIGGRGMLLEEAVPIAQQIADALEYAHERGIIHRDLKPANIKLTQDRTVKLLDFGLAKAMESPTRARPGNPSISPTLTMEDTRAGVILGTAAYMSPEQARGASVDKRADIWAFGVVVYEILTGKRLFEGATVSDTLAAVLKTEPDLAPIPEETQPLLRCCLEKEPKHRLRDIGDIGRLLGKTKSSTPAHRSYVPWVLAAALAVVAAIASWAPWRSTRPISQTLVRLSTDLPEFAIASDDTPLASFALSPDGKRLVYTGRGGDGTLRLYIRGIDKEQVVPVAGTEGAQGPFFSPDGQSVGFFAGGRLNKISLEHGGVVALCDASFSAGASWGEDGNIIAALHGVAGILSQIPSSGGTLKAITQAMPERGEFGASWPQVLPGADAVLFTALPDKASFEEASIVVQSLHSGQRKAILHGGYFGRYLGSGHLAYMHLGTLYVAPMDLRRMTLTGPAVPVLEEVMSDPGNSGGVQVSFAQTGAVMYVRGKLAKKRLAWLDSGGLVQPLYTLLREQTEKIRLSPDGKRLAMSLVEEGNTNIWVYDWEPDKLTRLTFKAGYEGDAVWSPDGKHLVIASAQHGVANLYWMRADGAGERVRLTEKQERSTPIFIHPGWQAPRLPRGSPSDR